MFQNTFSLTRIQKKSSRLVQLLIQVMVWWPLGESLATSDMGSNILIVRPDILQGTNVSIHPVKSSLRTVTGATPPIHGRGEFPLEVGSFRARSSGDVGCRYH